MQTAQSTPAAVVAPAEAEVIAPLAAEEHPQAPASVAEPPPMPVVHTVEEGESLRMLAARFGISVDTIMAANQLTNPDLLKVGQELVILPTNGVLHTVSEGESLRRIAEHYEVAITEIIAANDFGGNPDVVVVGNKLVIPGASPTAHDPGSAQSVAVAGDGEQLAATVSTGGHVSPVVGETIARRAAPSPRTYEVQEGDTLRDIAETFGVDVATILSSNGIADPDTIKPGTELRILPVKGIEYEVEPGITLADVAWRYQVDLGLLLDYNDLDNPDVIRVGAKLIVPGGKLRPEAASSPSLAVPVPAITGGGPAVAPAPKPAPKPAAPAPVAPQTVVGRGGQSIVENAMKFRGFPYVFGGTSPRGFDCSGFVFYIHQVTGSPVGRGMWQQLNGGARIGESDLLPGDTVFFANTYMPGLSHNGIYVGGGQFIHASDPSTGVVISNMNSSYWASRYVGATRLWS
jgi:cell wall-associated NlpC family hydrolase